MKSLFIKLNKLRTSYIKFPRKYSTDNKTFPPTPISEIEKTFSLIQFKRSLKVSGYDFEDGFTSLKTVCPICEPSDTKDNQHTVYLNKITGQFICPKCQHVDSFYSVCEFFNARKGNQAMAKQKEKFISGKPKLFEMIKLDGNIKEYSKLDEEAKNSCLNNLGINIPSAAFSNVDAFYDGTNNELIFPMYNVENQVVGYKRLKNINNEIEEFTIPEHGAHGLIFAVPKSQTTKSKENNTAVIVSNVLDLLAMNTKKVNGTIVCLPQGCKSLPIECLPSLERFQKLILWFNHDVPGWETSKSFAKKLDEKRCFFVRPIDSHPSPYLALQQNLDIKQILSKSQSIIHKSITTFHALRQDVLSDLQNIDKVQGVKWKRYPLLNKYLKGHRKGELTILTGSTGCGKTTFMSEYSLDLLLQGVTTLWGSFEIRNTRLASTLLRQMAGHPLDENINEFDFWADEFEKLPLYFMTFHGQQSIKIVMEAIEHAQYVHDINHVIIDNLQFMMGMTDEAKHIDRFWKQDAIIASFRTFATKKNCHVTLVIHPRKERDTEDLTTSSIFGSAKAAQEADNVLIIQDKRLTSIRGKKYLQIAKNRYSGDLGIMPLDFDKLGLSYATKKKKVDDKSNADELSAAVPKE